MGTVEILVDLIAFRVMTKRLNRSVSYCIILRPIRHNRLNSHLGSLPHTWVRFVTPVEVYVTPQNGKC